MMISFHSLIRRTRIGTRFVSTARLTREIEKEHTRILTPEALKFVTGLQEKFGDARSKILNDRIEREKRFLAGERPDFLKETEHIRKGDWKVAPIPKDFQDRRVEITGPVSPKMVINALNAGAQCFLADFEDSNSPTWRNNLEGQLSLYGATRRALSWKSPEGKEYKLNPEHKTVLMVRPRGWHMEERLLEVDGKPMSASLFDFGLYLFHNHTVLKSSGTGPYFYLPKMEGHLEARLWNQVFEYSEKELGIAPGTIRATVLIETILASFEMDEMLYELRNYSAGLNCGRWDYIFNYIKKFRTDPALSKLPDRSDIVMTQKFMSSYVDLLIQTCHRRGIHAMGGMSAHIPIRNNPTASAAQLQKVREDKLREVKAGHDGTWVAHPDLIPIAQEVFNTHMKKPNQIDFVPPVTHTVTAADLLELPTGKITEHGIRHNTAIGILYLEAWLRGNGCVPIFNLMEDAATAEIARTQIWCWLKHSSVTTDTGIKITPEYVKKVMKSECDRLKSEMGEAAWNAGKFELALELFAKVSLDMDNFPQFLTTEAYEYID